MAKKQKTKAAAKAPAASKGPKAPGKPHAPANVYTVLTCITALMLCASLIFVLIRSNELFGSMGELFNLQTQKPAQVQRTMPAAEPAPEAQPAENQ